MESLHLELLGSPHISLGEKPLTGFTTTKALALFIYLAATQRVHSRDVLASLLWCDIPDRQAKKNLRNTLPNLRALIGSHLTITRHSVAFNRASPYRLDVEVFRSTLESRQTAMNPQALKEASALYRGDFLRGFHVRDVPEFEEWVLMEREHLRAMAIDGLTTLVDQCIEQNDYETGLVTSKRLLTLDPWSENAHQQFMMLLAYSGQRSAALAHYKVCRTILADELGVEPLAETTALYEQIKLGALSPPQPVALPPLQPGSLVCSQVDWNELPKRTIFYGRQNELTQLHQWVVEDGAGLVGLFGIGGQGKTALAAQLIWTLAEEGHARKRHREGEEQGFERIIWRSLVNAPPFAAVLQGWLTSLSDHQVTQVPHQVDEQLALLFDHLRQQRCLLILDRVECILQDDPCAGELRPGYEIYGQVLQQLSQRVHRSCLLLLSRVRPKVCDIQDLDTVGVRSLQLRGLSEDAGGQLLQAQGLSGSHEALTALMARYSGHPLALKLVAMTGQELFAGDLEAFVTDDSPIFDDIRHVLDQQCVTLSPLEKEIMTWLAVKREPMSFQTLQGSLLRLPSKSVLLEALRALQRRSLLETCELGFGLQNVVKEYISNYMRETVSLEQAGQLSLRLGSNTIHEVG